jgi:hypothetical protein
MLSQCCLELLVRFYAAGRNMHKLPKPVALISGSTLIHYTSVCAFKVDSMGRGRWMAIVLDAVLTARLVVCWWLEQVICVGTVRFLAYQGHPSIWFDAPLRLPAGRDVRVRLACVTT